MLRNFIESLFDSGYNFEPWYRIKPMKNAFALGFLALALTTVPAFANEADTAVKNERRAEGQEIKAERAAAHGNVGAAERHEENARRDEHKARHEERRAIRKGEY